MTGTRDLRTWLWDYETNRELYDLTPDVVVDVLALTTRLGDGAVVVAFAMVFYWFGKRHDWQRRGMLVAIAVATLSINAGLKGVLDVQRPLYAAMEAGDPLAFAPETHPGLSTPSAHAMGVAAIYGGLAVLMDVGKKWQRYLVAGALILAVGYSRIVIGVHYVGDVITGILLGLGLVWVALWLESHESRSILSLYVLALIVALVSNPLGSEEFVTMSIGASAGGLVAWAWVRDRNPQPLGASILVFGVLLVPFLLGFRVFEALVTIDIFVEVGGTELPVMAGIRAIGYAILIGVAIAVPVFAERLDDWPTVQRIQSMLPFEGRTVDPEKFQQDHAD